MTAKVLIVDDELDNIFSLESVLKEDRYEISYTTKSVEATALALEKKPDVILLDIHMPRLNGFDLCKQLKALEETKNIPILFITARYKHTESLVKGLEVGGTDYIVKPFDSNELRARVRVLVRLKEQIEQVAELKKKTFSKELCLTLKYEMAHALQVIRDAIVDLSEEVKEHSYAASRVMVIQDQIGRIQNVLDKLGKGE